MRHPGPCSSTISHTGHRAGTHRASSPLLYPRSEFSITAPFPQVSILKHDSEPRMELNSSLVSNKSVSQVYLNASVPGACLLACLSSIPLIPEAGYPDSSSQAAALDSSCWGQCQCFPGHMQHLTADSLSCYSPCRGMIDAAHSLFPNPLPSSSLDFSGVSTWLSNALGDRFPPNPPPEEPHGVPAMMGRWASPVLPKAGKRSPHLVPVPKGLS